VHPVILYPTESSVNEPCVPGMLNGALRAVKCIPGALPLLHASQGCQESLYFDGCFSPVKPRFCLQKMIDEPFIPSTIINEQDVIFGAEENLEVALHQIYERNDPDLIVILTSDASEIIGDDVTDVMLTVRQSVSSQIINAEAGSLNGDHIDGFRVVMEAVVEQLMLPQEKRKYTVNLLGVPGDEVSSHYDVQELTLLLSAMGITTQAVLLSGSTLADLVCAPRASLNIIIHEELGTGPARLMEEKFNIPSVVSQPPYGIEGTGSWLLDIASHFGLEEQAQNIVENLSRKTLHTVRKYERDINFSLDTGVSADPTSAAGFSRLLEELGCTITLLSVHRVPDPHMHRVFCTSDAPWKTILINPDYYQYKEVLKDIEDLDVIFGGFMDTLAAAEYGIPVIEIFYPLMRMVEWNGPLMGFKGAEIMACNLAKYSLQQWI
jgi:light-independent protochlorophyllide reductase B subunit